MSRTDTHSAFFSRANPHPNDHNPRALRPHTVCRIGPYHVRDRCPCSTPTRRWSFLRELHGWTSASPSAADRLDGSGLRHEVVHAVRQGPACVQGTHCGRPTHHRGDRPRLGRRPRGDWRAGYACRGRACCAGCGRCFAGMGARRPQMNEHGNKSFRMSPSRCAAAATALTRAPSAPCRLLLSDCVRLDSCAQALSRAHAASTAGRARGFDATAFVATGIAFVAGISFVRRGRAR